MFKMWIVPCNELIKPVIEFVIASIFWFILSIAPFADFVTSATALFTLEETAFVVSVATLEAELLTAEPNKLFNDINLTNSYF